MLRHSLALSCALILAQGQMFNGHVRSTELRENLILNPSGEELVEEAVLPQSFDWRDVDGKNLVTPAANQHIPAYCGSCWIHAAAAMINDRLKILRGGAFPDVQISRQALVNCVPGPNNTAPPGCIGGDTWLIYKYLTEHKIPDETCQAYKAVNDVCEPYTVCQNCVPKEAVAQAGLDQQCFGMTGYTGYGVSEYGEVRGEVAMMKEIFARGPIACGFVVLPEQFVFQYSENAALHEGVWVAEFETNISQIDHDVEIAGWGETPGGIKYWTVRNSWGSYWGDQGWYKIQRGKNLMQIEADCTWAVPTYDDLSDAMQSRQILGDYFRGPTLMASHPLPGVGKPPASSMAVNLVAQPTNVGIVSLLLAALCGATMMAALGLLALRTPTRVGQVPLLAA